MKNVLLALLVPLPRSGGQSHHERRENRMAQLASTIRGWRVLLTPLLLLPLAGCFEHTYTVGSGAPTAPVAYDEWRHHWLLGLISPEHELELQRVCAGTSDATIHQEQTLLNGLVGVLTGGIYAPRTIQIRCTTGRADLDLNKDELRRITSDPMFVEWVEAVLPTLVTDVVAAQAVK